uniref:eL8 n=1 Tax=Paranosema locustae TaxID=235221 RepID=UPI00187D6E15|nr:Chain LG0, eL8 [Paranosema locustae]
MASQAKREMIERRRNPRDLDQKHQREERKALIAERVHLYRNALRIPPAVYQFSTFLNQQDMDQVLSLFRNYIPETRAEKKKRLMSENPRAGRKPILIKFGLKHVTDLIERKEARIVIIASDVDPIEVVVFLPTLCRKMGIPYAIVNGKKELGTLVHLKSTSCICLCDVAPKDSVEFKNILAKINAIFMDNYEITMKKWGGGALLRDKPQESSAPQA